MTIHAIYKEGVFQPVERVDLPEGSEVEFEPRLVSPDEQAASLEGVYAILAERYDSGEHDVAERHSEHQP